MTDRWLDQFLGEPLGDATREEVLDALRGHILRTFVVEEENPDGTIARHLDGILVEAGRDPGDWENPELFSVVTSEAAMGWHKHAEILARHPALAAAVAEPPKLTFGVPATGIVQYPGAQPGTAGYRFTHDDGSALAVILWHDIMHLTDDGDVAPGMGDFEITVEGEAK
jgi:hypothetical protein